MNRIMRNSGAALAAIFIAGSLTACGPGSASSSRSDTNPTDVSTDLGNKKYELTLWDGAGLKTVDEALIAGVMGENWLGFFERSFGGAK